MDIDGSWQCQVCTLINQSSASSCEACGTARVMPKPSNAPTGVSYINLNDKKENAENSNNTNSTNNSASAKNSDPKSIDNSVTGVPPLPPADEFFSPGDKNYFKECMEYQTKCIVFSSISTVIIGAYDEGS